MAQTKAPKACLDILACAYLLDTMRVRQQPEPVTNICRPDLGLLGVFHQLIKGGLCVVDA